VELVAPAMSTQVVPLLERCHCRLVLLPMPVQVPVVAVSVRPSWAVPVTTGIVTTAGGSAATAVVGADGAFALPPAFVPVTRTRIVAPTSAAVSV